MKLNLILSNVVVKLVTCLRMKSVVVYCKIDNLDDLTVLMTSNVMFIQIISSGEIGNFGNLSLL